MTDKFCKDCKHMRPYNGSTSYALCGKFPTPAGYLDLVSGHDGRYIHYPYCSDQRSVGQCGQIGKEWEERPVEKGLWKMVKEWCCNRLPTGG